MFVIFTEQNYKALIYRKYYSYILSVYKTIKTAEFIINSWRCRTRMLLIATVSGNTKYTNDTPNKIIY